MGLAVRGGPDQSRAYSVRSLLVALVLVAMAPLLLVQVGMYYYLSQARQQQEYGVNLDIARTAAFSWGEFIRDIGRQEATIGAALMMTPAPLATQATEILSSSQQEYPPVSLFAWIDPSGKVVHATDPAALNLDVAGRTYFQQAIASPSYVVSNLLESKVDGAPVFVVARAIRDAQGRVGGVVAGIISPDHLGEHVLRFERRQGVAVIIVDAEGKLVYRDPRIALSWQERATVVRHIPMADKALAGEEVTDEVVSPFDGRKRLVSAAPIQGIGWGAAVSRPRGDVLATVQTGLSLALTFNMLVAAGSILAAMLISRQISRDVQRLQRHVGELGRGQAPNRSQVSRVRELRELVDEFDGVWAQRSRYEQALRRSEEDLKRSAADLARSNKELEQFAYVASHDMQEPLRMIASYVQLLQRRYKDLFDASAQSFMEHAIEGCQRLSRLINDLLSLSRVGTRGGEMEPAQVDDILQHVLATLRQSIDDASATVDTEPMPTVRCDRLQLAQVFQNLIVNALKFQPPGGKPRVSIGAERIEGQWRFFVRDNGIGIAADAAERVFVVFQRLHTQSEYPGTGIGLAICKKIVERHGGRIWVQSEPGKGSTFYFTIPDSAGA